MTDVLERAGLKQDVLWHFAGMNSFLDRSSPMASEGEVRATEQLIVLPFLMLKDLVWYANRVGLADANLRLKVGMNLATEDGFHPLGGPDIVAMLDRLLMDTDHLSSIETHDRFLRLSPFTAHNSYFARAIWLWHVVRYQDKQTVEWLNRGGFLAAFYRQQTRATPYRPTAVTNEAADFVEIATEDCAMIWSRPETESVVAEIGYAMRDRERIVGLRLYGIEQIRERRTNGRRP